MLDGTCPKCGSSEVYRNASVGEPPPVISGVRLYTDRSLMSQRSVPVTYVCIDCGYVEFYVNNAAFLERVQQKWHKVGDEKPKRDER